MCRCSSPIMGAAERFAPLARSRFLVAVAAHLPATPADGELQDAMQVALALFTQEARAS